MQSSPSHACVRAWDGSSWVAFGIAFDTLLAGWESRVKAKTWKRTRISSSDRDEEFFYTILLRVTLGILEHGCSVTPTHLPSDLQIPPEPPWCESARTPLR